MLRRLLLVPLLLAAASARADGVLPIEDNCVQPGGDACSAHAMDAFYQSLAALERHDAGAMVRVVQYGDSLTADDYIAGRARSRLQALYGDGGAGFVWIAPPHGSYRNGVSNRSTGWLGRTIITGGKKDGLYGLEGASFESGSGAAASFATTKEAPGDKVARFDIYYLEQPGGGSADVEIDGKAETTLDTAGTTARAAFRAIDVPDGAHTLTLRQKKGTVRAYGVVMERASGVVWDNLGLVSSSTRALTTINAEHFRAELGHREPALVLVFLGPNESDFVGSGADAIAAYQTTFEGLLAEVRAARPGATCLVMSPLDSAITTADGKIVTKPVIPKLVEAQRQAAKRQGCAFWSTFAWMGGKGSMAKWYARGSANKDLTHISQRAAWRVADALVDAMLAGYGDWQKAHASASAAR